MPREACPPTGKLHLFTPSRITKKLHVLLVQRLASPHLFISRHNVYPNHAQCHIRPCSRHRSDARQENYQNSSNQVASIAENDGKTGFFLSSRARNPRSKRKKV